jgi:predicted TIM-barrel fold metal-dependent hydrolase
MRLSIAAVVLLTTILTACATAPPPSGDILPLADHHAHLLSPVTSKMAGDPPLPAVQVPEELTRLLRAREAAWNVPKSLEPLYTEDSIIFDLGGPAYLHGREEVTKFIGTRFARAYRITPVAFHLGSDSGFLSGYFTRGEGEATKRFGHVQLSLVKASDGTWRIAAETPTFPGPIKRETRTTAQLISELDAAHIRYAAVLSTAYWFGSAFRPPEADAQAKTQAENDWTAAQVAQFPNRLAAFCSFNPLQDFALAELNRCADSGGFAGLKLHFGNSAVDLRNPEHLAKVREVFRAANRRHLAIIVHLWTGADYGRKEAEIFLDQLLPLVPDVPVQIAHFAGGGPGYTDEALAVYADAISKGDPRTKNLYFDVATVADEQSEATLKTFADRIRQVGLHRVLFGSDLGPPLARQSWLIFRTTVPLTDAELRTIAGNVAPYFRRR